MRAPFPPQVDAGSGFDHLVDVSAAHARRAFKKVKMPVGMRSDEFGMCHAPH